MSKTRHPPHRAHRVRLATPWYVWVLGVLFALTTAALLLGPKSWSDWCRNQIGALAETFNN